MRTKRFFFLLAALAVSAGAWAQSIYPDGYEPERILTLSLMFR